jgi:hypothetical protein
MEPAMSNKTERERKRHEAELSALSSADRLNRARSVTVGTTFNGVSELVMRTDGRYIFAILQPTEVIELIHQLAANVGCHIHIQPRNDFASWRKWKDVQSDSPGLNHPPFANHPPMSKLQSNSDYVAAQLAQRSQQNEQTVAIEKTVGRKRTKRAAAAP